MAQLLTGACVMALTMALNEEEYDLEEKFSLYRTLAVLPFLIFVLAGFS